jgi:hypothetical protein
MTLVVVASMSEFRTLILYGSHNSKESHQAQPNDGFYPNYRGITELEFREWGVVDTGSTNSGAVSLLQKLISKMIALHSMKFTDSFVDGESLVTVVCNARNGGGDGSLKALEEVTLSKVTGMTRTLCDVLADSVPKLNVYV